MAETASERSWGANMAKEQNKLTEHIPVSPTSCDRRPNGVDQPRSSAKRHPCLTHNDRVGLHKALRCPVPQAWWCRPPKLGIGEPKFRCRLCLRSGKLPAVLPAGSPAFPSFGSHLRIYSLRENARPQTLPTQRYDIRKNLDCQGLWFSQRTF